MAGRYDDWKSREPDPGREACRVQDPPLHRCRDCACEVIVGGHGAPWVQAVYCDECWRWRSARGVEFDTRARLQIEAAERQKGAA